MLYHYDLFIYLFSEKGILNRFVTFILIRFELAYDTSKYRTSIWVNPKQSLTSAQASTFANPLYVAKKCSATLAA